MEEISERWPARTAAKQEGCSLNVTHGSAVVGKGASVCINAQSDCRCLDRRNRNGQFLQSFDQDRTCGAYGFDMYLLTLQIIRSLKVVVKDVACIDDSFPGFVDLMREIGAVYD